VGLWLNPASDLPPSSRSALDSAPPTIAFNPRPVIQRQKLLQGCVFNVQWSKEENEKSFFACINLISVRPSTDLNALADPKDLGGTTVKSHTEPSITHFLLAPPHDRVEDVFHEHQMKREAKWQQIIRDYSKWYDPINKVFDSGRNRLEKRVRIVVRRRWLDDVLSGRLKVREEGQWGV
jgi:hypothetical protein